MNFKNLLSEYKEYSDFLAAIKNGDMPISVSGLVEAAWGQFIYQTANGKSALVIAYNDQEAERIAENLHFFLERVFVFPSKEYVFFVFSHVCTFWTNDSSAPHHQTSVRLTGKSMISRFTAEGQKRKANHVMVFKPPA